MNDRFSKEEQQLLVLLKRALQGNAQTNIECELFGDIKQDELIGLAKKHAVLPLLYECMTDNGGFETHRGHLEQESKKTVLQTYRLLFLTKYIVGILSEQGIKSVVLKGVATASFYPVPELRKSGDVDLLLPEGLEKDKLIKIMSESGFRMAEEQHANHHMVFLSNEGIHIEIHGMLAEPFANKKINRAMEIHMKDSSEHIQSVEVLGVMLPVLDKPYHAYELLLHMLQHFMYAGFGLKLLCDWFYVWCQKWSETERNLFISLVKESGMERFAEAVTSVCITYLGLEKEAFAWQFSEENMAEEMLREIMDSEEFGGSDKTRMVMMSGTGVVAYIEEFHHQMHLNFPKAGKCFLLWPVLWVVTLVRFLKNNKRVRNTSTKEILKEAKRRSKLMDKLNL